MPNARLSDAEHKARGTRPSPKVEPAPAKDKQGRPDKPTWLSPTASAEWDRVLPLLEARGSITPADSIALALYAESVSRYVLALKALQEGGLEVAVRRLDSNGQPHEVTKPNPALKLVLDTEKVIRQCLRELGLTPASREKIKPAAEPDADEGSGLLALLRQGRK